MENEWLDLVKTKALLDAKESIAGDFLERFEFPWQALPHIKDEIIKIGMALPPEEYEQRGEHIWI
ncbi:MAG TPA: UDP-N-acetylglucosamine pyrophosphorylase, partial [Candidatus Atribacteria bacterium]|nr:UDP-N-acetylglucosamine pyrophosphorylase [Candidatus Atribacteria bacterium]